MSEKKWDVRFLRIASHEVAGWSKDLDKKVGCLVVSPSRRQWTAGYNGFPVGVSDSVGRLADKDIKNRLSVHAELNAIFNARADLAGWTMYVTHPPCLDCAKAIIQAGLTRVVHPPIDKESRWANDQWSASVLLREVSIRTTVIDRKEYENDLQDQRHSEGRRPLRLPCAVGDLH